MVGLVARLVRSSLGPAHLAAACVASLAVSACVDQGAAGRYGTAAGPQAPSVTAPVPVGRRVAILAPLTGPNAELGRALLQAAQLSLAQPGSPPLDQQDTAGTPEGAATAARTAIAAGAGVLLGPLTNAETAAAAPIARAANVPMLAFTSDRAQAQPGVWTLGVTPGQQVRRLVLAMQAEGKTRIAAVLPQNALGDALAVGLLTAASDAKLPEPRIVRTPYTFAGFNDALKTVSDYGSRRGAIEAQQRAARNRGDADGRREAVEIGRRDVPPPPMDALFLGATGDLLGQVVPLLSFYDVASAQLRILGPSIWLRDAARQPGLAGAWFAAPDPGARAGFEQQYAAKYTIPPREFASLAYDSAGIARAIAAPDGFSVPALERSEGFAGADGLLVLRQDGTVRRGLAIFEVDRGGAHIVQPAPQTIAAPGS